MWIKKTLLFVLIAVVMLWVAFFAATARAAPARQAATVTLRVLNPQGLIPVVNGYAPRLSTLDGKKVAFWLMLPNTFEFQPAGRALFDRVGESLKKQFPKVTIASYDQFFSDAEAEKALASLKDVKPDAVILGVGG